MQHKNIKKECEELWAKNKYYVLSKSHKVYLNIREYLKEKEVKKIFIMPFYMYGDISKKKQVKRKNKDYSLF